MSIGKVYLNLPSLQHRHCIKYARIGFSLTVILPYKDKIYDFVLIEENSRQWKPVFPLILCSALFSCEISKFFRKAFLKNTQE